MRALSVSAIPQYIHTLSNKCCFYFHDVCVMIFRALEEIFFYNFPALAVTSDPRRGRMKSSIVLPFQVIYVNRNRVSRPPVPGAVACICMRPCVAWYASKILRERGSGGVPLGLSLDAIFFAKCAL